MAYQSRDAIDAMSRASGRTVRELRVDGGASVMPLLLQFQADQLGVTVRRCSQPETTALGAAFLAGYGAGVWQSLDDISATWQADAVVEPKADRTTADHLHNRWLRAVNRSRSWVDPD
jgi:glycerol kinase